MKERLFVAPDFPLSAVSIATAQIPPDVRHLERLVRGAQDGFERNMAGRFDAWVGNVLGGESEYLAIGRLLSVAYPGLPSYARAPFDESKDLVFERLHAFVAEGSHSVSGTSLLRCEDFLALGSTRPGIAIPGPVSVIQAYLLGVDIGEGGSLGADLRALRADPDLAFLYDSGGKISARSDADARGLVSRVCTELMRTRIQ